jgi:hypothetical protein
MSAGTLFGALLCLIGLATFNDAQEPAMPVASDSSLEAPVGELESIRLPVVVTVPQASENEAEEPDGEDLSDVGCFEDEIIVRIVAEVQSDDGQEPGVDWGWSERTGTLVCVPADDIDWSRS